MLSVWVLVSWIERRHKNFAHAQSLILVFSIGTISTVSSARPWPIAIVTNLSTSFKALWNLLESFQSYKISRKYRYWSWRVMASLSGWTFIGDCLRYMWSILPSPIEYITPCGCIISNFTPCLGYLLMYVYHVPWYRENRCVRGTMRHCSWVECVIMTEFMVQQIRTGVTVGKRMIRVEVCFVEP